MNVDAFISYSHHDKTTADATCAVLEANAIRCWIAPRDIVPGMDWGESIMNAIVHTRVMILVYSGQANNSQQVKREVERAVNKGIPIIPLRIENAPMSGALEYFLSTPHWLDAMTPPLERHLERLAQSVQSLLKMEVPTGAPPHSKQIHSDQTAPTRKGFFSFFRSFSKNNRAPQAARGAGSVGKVQQAVQKPTSKPDPDPLVDPAEVKAALARVAANPKPSSAEDFYAHGLQWFVRGDNDRSIEFFDRAISLDPKLSKAHYMRGLMCVLLGQFDRSGQYFTEAARLDPKHVKAHLAASDWHNDRRDWDAAIDHLTAALALKQNNSAIFQKRGSMYLSKREFDNALPDLDKALALDPFNKEAFESRALVFAQNGNDDRAIEDFGAVIRLDPNNKKALSLRAGLYQFRKRDYANAAKDYSHAIQLDPTNVELFYNRAVTYASSKQPAQSALAVKDFDEVVKLDPKYAKEHDVFFLRAGLRFEIGDYQNAIKNFDEVIGHDPNNGDALYHRGLAKRRLADEAGAESDIRSAKAINPDVGL